MPTIQQLVRKSYKSRKLKRSKKKSLIVSGKCQLSVVCTKSGVMNPKKPNSAMRKIIRFRAANGIKGIAHIPGEGHNIVEHASLYINGRRCKDLIGVKYSVVRGRGDCAGVDKRSSSRSIYGVKASKKVKSV